MRSSSGRFSGNWNRNSENSSWIEIVYQAEIVVSTCGHSFCNKCLLKMKTPYNTHQMVIKCPFDRIASGLNNETSCLKKNFYILKNLTVRTVSSRSCRRFPNFSSLRTLPKIFGLACPTHPALLFCRSTTCNSALSLMCSECVVKGPHKNPVYTALDEDKRSRKRKLEGNEADIAAETDRSTKLQKMCSEALNSYNALRRSSTR